jgi:hypothetical protein
MLINPLLRNKKFDAIELDWKAINH